MLEADPTHGAARAVLLENAYQSGQIVRVGEALLESSALAGGMERERALASALLAQLAGDVEQMVVDAERVTASSPSDEAAMRMTQSGRSDLVKKIFERILLPYVKLPLGSVALLASGRSLRDEERRVLDRGAGVGKAGVGELP